LIYFVHRENINKRICLIPIINIYCVASLLHLPTFCSRLDHHNFPSRTNIKQKTLIFVGT
jgi:hypothetical protein